LRSEAELSSALEAKVQRFSLPGERLQREEEIGSNDKDKLTTHC
jgi:hypothetical protein